MFPQQEREGAAMCTVRAIWDVDRMRECCKKKKGYKRLNKVGEEREGGVRLSRHKRMQLLSLLPVTDREKHLLSWL